MNDEKSADDPEFYKFGEILEKTQRLIHKLNTEEHTQKEIQEILAKITGKPIDDSVHVLLPFYADFGQHITIGKNVFINMGCTFVDKGGLTIEDDVLIGPQVKILTVNHPIDPKKKRQFI
nr:hypothetical protein [Lacticigenium naphthae]